MQAKDITRLATAAGSAVLAGAAVRAAEQPQVDATKVDEAFNTLKTYDWAPTANC